jgi:sterol desaturase/sphingolipid hydroxylase (fatty acid hydroxylase superfamily)
VHWSDLLVLFFVIGMFAVEWVLLSLRGRTIDFHQTTLNLTLGMMERLFALLSLGFGLRLLSVLLPFRLMDAIEPAWLNFILAFISVDLFWYVYHRISHRVSLVWIAHLVHHQPEEYNMSVNFANSPLGYFVRVLIYSPMVFFGLDPEYILLAQVVNGFYQVLLHSELWPRWKGVERYIVTPYFHQLHHSSAHAHLDKNYGGMFTIWDRIFGSYHDGSEPSEYGLTKAIEQRDPYYVSTFYAARLVQNFREFPFRTAFRLLFAGPECQPTEMPRLYRVAVRPTPLRLAVGFGIFIAGYIGANFELLPFWGAFILAFFGIFSASGMPFFLWRKEGAP